MCNFRHGFEKTHNQAKDEERAEMSNCEYSSTDARNIHDARLNLGFRRKKWLQSNPFK